MLTATRKNMNLIGGSRRVDKMLSGLFKILGRPDRIIGRTVKITLALPIIAISLIGISVRPGQAAEATIEQMPAKLETQFALSAAPPALRDQASVYLLDPKTGYQLSQQGTSGVTCLVERTVWELADFRNDIYIPLCYDAVGARTYLKVIMDTARLRAQGMSPTALKAEIENRYDNKTYKAPENSGLSYMVAPVFRTVGPPDMKVHTMPMPHLMFYAPNLTNDDIGALPNLGIHASLLYPFIDKQGIAEQSYMIQLIGEAEKAKILADEKTLLDELCAYRDVLCLPHTEH
jgi:hypothetical protein